MSFGSGGGTAEISNSIVSGNTSTDIDSASGAIRHDATDGVMTITHSEISGNIAAGDGGGIHLDGYQGTFQSPIARSLAIVQTGTVEVSLLTVLAVFSILTSLRLQIILPMMTPTVQVKVVVST